MSPLGRITAGLGVAAVIASSALAGTDVPAASADATDAPPVAAETAKAGPQATAPATGETEQAPKILRAALEVETQTVADGAVTIDMAWMPEAGFVVLHPLTEQGLSPETLGYAPVSAGDNEMIKVSLDQDVTHPTAVVAMLHRDTGEAGAYEFGANAMDSDQPELIGGRPVAAAFHILPAKAPDAAPAEGGQSLDG